eukprot:TRINITY_DN23586_c0_g1_i2.p1 TRINITY_DN23586_c0_g1~~TRINITY_DN23586_c0_g1_i2.p1  ORF type:complete len:215 (+),score=53.83 TRINITY_DN23586_c0_g1_i2:166-810(+)
MEGYTEVCTVEELESHRRKRVNAAVHGRYVTIFRFGEPPQLFCMDTSCYHAGGSLALGDIEEVNGVPCVKCPIHQFRLSLTDGRQAVFTYDVVDDKVGPCYLHFPDEQPPRQRVHEVVEKAGKIYVRLSSEDATGNVEVASDRLAYRGDVVTSNGARVHCVVGESKPTGGAEESGSGNRRRSTTLPGGAETPMRDRAPTLPGSSAADGADDEIV